MMKATNSMCLVCSKTFEGTRQTRERANGGEAPDSNRDGGESFNEAKLNRLAAHAFPANETLHILLHPANTAALPATTSAKSTS
jgi:hypothetical protein